MDDIQAVCIHCHRVLGDHHRWEEPVTDRHFDPCAQVFNTICPDCSQRLFPQFYGFQKEDKMDVSVLRGKTILVVDDETDVIDTIVDLLDKCRVDSAVDFASAKAFLGRQKYDAAILDIMGVNGFGLLDVAIANGIPALVLTAHALSADNFKKSITAGAYAYVPKDEMIDIPDYLAELLTAAAKGKKSGKWFNRLVPYFDRIFGADWKTADKVFWNDFKDHFTSMSDELRRIL